MVFGSRPADPYGWKDKGEDLAFAQDTSSSGRFVQQWKLRMMTQKAALKEIANSRLRKLLALNKSSTCTDTQIGDAVLFYKAQSRKSAPQWWSPTLISDIDETGATVKFHSQDSKVARFCARKRGEEKEVGENELDSARDSVSQGRACTRAGLHFTREDLMWGGIWRGAGRMGIPR